MHGKSKPSKLILFVVGGLAGIVVLVIAVAALLLHLNAKPRLEAVASEDLGMEFSIGGRLDIRFPAAAQEWNPRSSRCAGSEKI